MTSIDTITALTALEVRIRNVLALCEAQDAAETARVVAEAKQAIAAVKAARKRVAAKAA